VHGVTYPCIEEYLYGLLPKRDDVLTRLEAEAEAEGWPIVGPLVGRLLYLLVKSTHAKRVLELGTAIGYSTIWLGRGVRDSGGTVTAVEVNHQTAERARRNLREAGLSRIVKVVEGDAAGVIKQLKEKFDLIFIDVDKETYPKILKRLIAMLNTRGVLVADNCLWGGSVATQADSSSTISLRRFNQLAMSNPLLEGAVLPIRDGVYIGLKK
jgi:predicted O-methyltransferase YrrM